MAIIKIKSRDYTPQPGDEILSRCRRFRNGITVEDEIVIKRFSLEEESRGLVYRPDPSGGVDPMSGERTWGYYPGPERKKAPRTPEREL